MFHALTTLLLLAGTTFGHRPDVTAIYYDSAGFAYKVEQRYTSADTTTYITHDNTESFCISSYESHSEDTTILHLCYSYVFTHPTHLDSLRAGDDIMITKNECRDTAWVTSYFTDYVTGAHGPLADTMLTGLAAENSFDFTDQLKYARVPAIIAAGAVEIDSIRLLERVLMYSVHGLPVRVKHYDQKDQLENIILGTITGRGAIYRCYFTTDSLQYYEADTARWSRSHSYLSWSTDRFDWHKVYRRSMHIKGTREDLTADDASKKSLTYLQGTDIFLHDLLSEILYDDTPFYSELYYFDRAQLRSYREGRARTQYRYTYDTRHRISAADTYKDTTHLSRTTYIYSH